MSAVASTVETLTAELAKVERNQKKAPASRKANYETKIASLKEAIAQAQAEVETTVETPKATPKPRKKPVSGKKVGRPHKYQPKFYEVRESFRRGNRRGRPNREMVVADLKRLKVRVPKNATFRELEMLLAQAREERLSKVKVPVKA